MTEIKIATASIAIPILRGTVHHNGEKFRPGDTLTVDEATAIRLTKSGFVRTDANVAALERGTKYRVRTGSQV